MQFSCFSLRNFDNKKKCDGDETLRDTKVKVERTKKQFLRDVGEGQRTVQRKQGQLERKRRSGAREALQEGLECRRTGPQQYTGEQGEERSRGGGGGGEGGEEESR